MLRRSIFYSSFCNNIEKYLQFDSEVSNLAGNSILFLGLQLFTKSKHRSIFYPHETLWRDFQDSVNYTVAIKLENNGLAVRCVTRKSWLLYTKIQPYSKQIGNTTDSKISKWVEGICIGWWLQILVIFYYFHNF